ncbi:unnamed protein product [Effrenium voratum]|nr:unnamed protein product [Effrenium voratum]
MQRALLRLPRRRRFWSLAVCAAWPASSWVPSLAPRRVLSRCVAAKAEASDGEVPSAEVVLQQLEESGLFEGQEEMLLRLRMLAAQGVHPLDALRASRLQEDRRGQEEPRDAVLESFDIEGVAKYMQASKCKNVVVMCGAGISTSAGIPDFRTPGSGLYDNLQRYNLSQPELIFDLAFFQSQPAPFYELCKELWPGTYRPTRAHYFIRLLEEKGVLRRCYTQNIDSLERQAGLSPEKVVAAHGNMDEAHVLDSVPERKVDIEDVRRAIFAGEEGWQALRQAHGGLVKPKIVMFGEDLPDRFWELQQQDLQECDLLIVIGTSLVVEPFAGLVGKAAPDAPRLLINREPAGTCEQRVFGFRFQLPEGDNWRDVWFEGSSAKFP